LYIKKKRVKNYTSGLYKPGFRILELSSYILQRLDLRDIARPYLITIKDGCEGVYRES